MADSELFADSIPRFSLPLFVHVRSDNRLNCNLPALDWLSGKEGRNTSPHCIGSERRRVWPGEPGRKGLHVRL